MGGYTRRSIGRFAGRRTIMGSHGTFTISGIRKVVIEVGTISTRGSIGPHVD